MDPLITNGVDPALLRTLEKRGHERDAGARRKRPAAAPENIADEEAQPDPDLENPKHALDDLA